MAGAATRPAGAVGTPDERSAERVLDLAREQCERRRTNHCPVQRGVRLGELAAQLAGGLLGLLGGVAGGEKVGTEVVVGLLARPDEAP